MIDHAAINELFDEIGYSVSSEDGDVSYTDETIDDVKIARQKYSDIGKLYEGSVNGFAYIELSKVQVQPGKPRRNVVAIQLADKLAFISQ